MFWNSLSGVEKQHIIDAFSFELAQVNRESVRQQVVDMFVNVDKEMATTIANNVGISPPKGQHVRVTASSPALSQANTPHYAYSLKVGVLIGNDFHDNEVRKLLDSLQENGVFVEIISEKLGTVVGTNGMKIKVTKTFLTTHEVLLDSLYVVGGRTDNQMVFDSNVTEFVLGAYRHYKPIAIATTGKDYLRPSEYNNLAGVIYAENNADFEKEFTSAVGRRRFWNRT